VQALARRDVLAMTFTLMTAAASWGVIIGFLAILVEQRGAGVTAPFFTIYAIVTVVMRLVIGPMTDRVGRKTVAVPATLLLAVVMIAFSFLSSPLVLYVLAVFYAFSFGMLYPTLSAFLVDVVPAQVRGSAVGVLTAGFDLGIVVGSSVGGLVAEYVGLGATFATIGVLCLGGAVVLWLGTHEVQSA
jgi:MFS family permease